MKMNKKKKKKDLDYQEINNLSGNIQIILDSKDNKTNKDLLDSKDKLTLDILLNILDGILTTSGQIIIMTTNHKEILDKALIRPGRIDVFLELSKCNGDMISKLCKNFYNVAELKNNEKDIIESIAEYEYSPAHVMNIFRRYKNSISDGLLNIKYS